MYGTPPLLFLFSTFSFSFSLFPRRRQQDPCGGKTRHEGRAKESDAAVAHTYRTTKWIVHVSDARNAKTYLRYVRNVLLQLVIPYLLAIYCVYARFEMSCGARCTFALTGGATTMPTVTGCVTICWLFFLFSPFLFLRPTYPPLHVHANLWPSLHPSRFPLPAHTSYLAAGGRFRYASP